MVVNDDATIAQIIAHCRIIAVVGLSDKPDRPSHDVARAMQLDGIRIVPVNPMLGHVLGEKAYPDLNSIPFPVAMVNCFRRSEDIPLIGQSIAAMQVRPRVLWMQLGIEHLPTAQLATRWGLQIVMNRCWKIERRRLLP